MCGNAGLLGNCAAPKFDLVKRYKCGIVFCENLCNTQKPLSLWRKWDDLGIPQLTNEFNTLSYFNKFRSIACCSCQKRKGKVGTRVFRYNTQFAPQSYSKTGYNALKSGYECQEVGVGRVKEWKGKRYILFNKIYGSNSEYEKESRKLLTKYYPYGGEFYIVNRRSMQLQCMDMSFIDCPLDVDLQNIVGANDAKNVCMYPKEYSVNLYEYDYIVTP